MGARKGFEQTPGSVTADSIGHGICLDETYGGCEELVDLVLKHKIPLGLFNFVLF